MKTDALLFAATVALALLGWLLFNDISGSALGAITGIPAVRRRINKRKAAANESDERQEFQEQQSQEHLQDADLAHEAAQQATEKETEDKTGEALENAFSHRRRR